MTDTQSGDYQPPVSALLTIGRPGDKTFADWPDYIALHGFTSDHIPELSRLVTDQTYMEPEYDERAEVYAFIHAIRALGQLRDAAALPVLLQIAETEMDSDWIWEQIPYAIALIGPSAIPQLAASLGRTKNQAITGLTVVDCIEKMTEVHPEAREECIAVLTDRLAQAADNDAGVNANIISTLADFKALDSLSVIEQAFATDNVDLMVMGDWDDVQVEFGLKEPDPNKPRRVNPVMQEILETMTLNNTGGHSARTASKRKAKAKTKAKRKQAKKSRRQTRKRK